MGYDREYFEHNQQLQDRPALRWYARICDRLLAGRPSDVLEFGCGVGWLLKHLRERHHHRVSGYDLSDFCRVQARLKNPGMTIYETQDCLPRSAFDLVVALHVLEHVPAPAATLTLLASLLKRGGQLFFVVPAVSGLGHRLKGQRWFAYRDPTHVSLLPEAEWRSHVLAAGLEPVRAAGDGLWDPPYVRVLPRSLQLALFGAPAALQVYLGRGRLLLPARWSECLIMVARRPAVAR